ncbi:Na(+)-translocating NADH-quinone reductase subunit F [Flavobacterium jejuense]|uniref:Na(+)-translocating NADH-quinone reductase subunit F n=1 Tax=Flavobacterium jejuense TaxID=1544455 RepID=A0ABX0IVX5_9FLAO|nr:Na(+)-translocating NADH-quinone reductase subunit F [Flavobacterium jejuense]NHN26922.1 Na(+)-translocating NADH-quinone reductase subunit F [Flavobacterium jejuense]
METTKRFTAAIHKLYNAFHNNTLNPLCCNQCAVGNILDNKDFWKHLSNYNGSLQLNYVGLVNQNLGKRFNGYTPIELLQIEMVFLKACEFQLPLHRSNSSKKIITKDILFKGLEAVVSKLCELDRIPNVMDCSVLFEYETTYSNKETSLLMHTV